MWDADKGQETCTFPGHTHVVSSVAFSADGRRIASGADSVMVWDAGKGQEVLTLRGDAYNVSSVEFSSDKVSSVEFSADGKRILAKYEKGRLRSWDAIKGQEVIPCTDPPPEGQREAVSPDGKLRIWADGTNVHAARSD